MKAKEFLNNVCKEIKYKPANRPIFEEKEAHIEELKNDNLCKGLSEEQAEEYAVEQMGDAKKIGKRLNKIHRPKLDWKLIILILIMIVFKFILYFVDYSGSSFWEVMRCMKYMLIGLGMSVAIYFFDYRKSQKWYNLIFCTATGILICQWINDYFCIDKAISDGVYLLNMRMWNICIPLYIIAFAGNIANYNKKDLYKIIMFYTISCVLMYWKSYSIMNTLILVLAYLTIVSTKILQTNKKDVKKVFAIYASTLSIAIIIMHIMTNMRVPYLFYGSTAEGNYVYNGYWYENSQKYEEKILNNLNLIGPADAPEEVSRSNSSHFRFLHILGRLGIIPATILAVAIILMCIRLIKNSKNIKEVYGKYVIIGLSTTYVAQALIHILMNLNLLIRSDVNLPFVAEGNLYFLINCFTFAIILSVYRRKDINFEEPKKSKLFAKIEDFLFEDVEENEEGVI